MAQTGATQHGTRMATYWETEVELQEYPYTRRLLPETPEGHLTNLVTGWIPPSFRANFGSAPAQMLEAPWQRHSPEEACICRVLPQTGLTTFTKCSPHLAPALETRCPFPQPARARRICRAVSPTLRTQHLRVPEALMQEASTRCSQGEELCSVRTTLTRMHGLSFTDWMTGLQQQSSSSKDIGCRAILSIGITPGAFPKGKLKGTRDSCNLANSHVLQHDRPASREPRRTSNLPESVKGVYTERPDRLHQQSPHGDRRD
jgi:hypothetical protein